MGEVGETSGVRGRSVVWVVLGLFGCGPEAVVQAPPVEGIYAVEVTVVEDTCEPRSCDARWNSAIQVRPDHERIIADVGTFLGEGPISPYWSSDRLPFSPDPEATEFRYRTLDVDFEPACGNWRMIAEVLAASAEELVVRVEQRYAFPAACSASGETVDCTRTTLNHFTLKTGCELADCPPRDLDIQLQCD